MERNDVLQIWKHMPPPAPDEEKIRQITERGKEVYFRQEQNRFMGYGAFLWSQFRMTRKRWWIMQAALLMLACQILPAIEIAHNRIRTLGVIGCLFAVTIIPELWRNQEWNSLQVEAACLYSLRQIYAARITLFGGVDVVLLSLFSLALGWMGFTVLEVISQFLLPLTVTACICFRMLCGNGRFSEAVSLTACLTWSGIWWLILMNETVYARILPTVWAALFAAALLFLALAVRRTLRTTNQYWEVEFV